MLSIEARDRELATFQHARNRKLPALFAHFDIPEDCSDRWRLLALALAGEHVPGFCPVRATGAPIKETVVLLCRLYRYFIRTKADRIRRIRERVPTDADICRALAKDENFKRAIPELKSVSSKTLQNRVGKARKLRRAYLTDFVERCAYSRRVGPEGSEDGLFHFGDPPDWYFGYADKVLPRT